MADLELTVNGTKRRIAAPETTPLIYVLHNELGLTGSRYGCGLEQCGSCMVLVDGEPVYSCSREVGTLVGRAVTTIESLGTVEKPHPLQQAFIDEQAGQCGYCLSGIIIAGQGAARQEPAAKPCRDRRCA